MVYYLITALHVIVCIILILVVLLQSGKGADLAGAFGGGSTQTAFGSRGPASFLSKMTTGAAVIFMITSIALSSMTMRQEGTKSILETTGTKSQVPATNATTPAAPKPLTPEQIRQQQLQIEEQQKQKQTPAVPQGVPSTPAETPGKASPPPKN